MKRVLASGAVFLQLAGCGNPVADGAQPLTDEHFDEVRDALSEMDIVTEFTLGLAQAARPLDEGPSRFDAEFSISSYPQEITNMLYEGRMLELPETVYLAEYPEIDSVGAATEVNNTLSRTDDRICRNARRRN